MSIISPSQQINLFAPNANGLFDIWANRDQQRGSHQTSEQVVQHNQDEH